MKQALRKTLAATVLTALVASAAIVGCGDSASDDVSTAGSYQMSKQDNGRVPPPGKNRLYFEKSPYLLQHAENPVDWYPWGEEAFAKARAEDKPIFLSIGYSTCHWCHVMEHESFEDEEVARHMNETFVCIKVDREERPDVDNIYMTVCQIMTGRGGWPLTILMTPDRVPFFAGTYFPKPAMLAMIPKVEEAWSNDRTTVLKYADQLQETLQGVMTGSSVDGAVLGTAELKAAYGQLASRYDPAMGGFGEAPKFPTPHNLLFLLRYWKRSGDATALQMVENTLEKMRLGGVYDHVGFGFHRYSTDERWFLPHFEKMLYDQGMLLMAYTEAYQATGNEAYRSTAEEIVTYVLRDMTDTQGGFYSAEDADSEGEEGKFYVWTEAELRQVLGDDSDFVIGRFGVTSDGNWQEEASGHRSGSNILYLEKPLSETAEAGGENVDADALRERWESARVRLFAEREKRIHPYKDDKILTDWNGLMVAALAMASRAFGEPSYAESAAKAADFVMTRMVDPGGGLYHRYRDGEAAITSMVDDYVFFVWGLLELYETTFDTDYLAKALHYNEYLIEHFWDDGAGGFFLTSDSGEKLIVRPKDVYDGAIPSGNSAAMLNLLRLSRITARTQYGERANDVGRAFRDQVARGASAFTMMMSAVDFAVGPSFEIVVAGHTDREDSRRMVAEINRHYIPNKVVVFRPEEKPAPLVKLVPYTKSQSAVNGKATAYVCRNFACELPTTDINKMLELLNEQ
jgi:uncharacterized protein YyaL (SSP411 family)